MFSGASYFDDILTVAIGFATIMLLLSLVVTAVVQIIQNIFSLRFKNLSRGIFSVLGNFEQTKNITLDDVKNKILVSPFKDTKFFNQKKTWIKPDELVSVVETMIETPLVAKEIEKIKQSFVSLYGFMQKRFLALTRVWSAAFAILIAFTFQVDSFDLLRRISSDPEMRLQLEQTAIGLVGENGQDMFSTLTYEDISDSALVSLQTSYPKLAQQIEQVSGIGQDRDEIIQELDDIMTAELPDMKEEVVEKYGDLLDDLHQKEIQQGLERYNQYTGQLALFDIRPFNYGWDYYWNIQNILGMLMTAIFLTFGAPFWFERLRELIKLKDVIGQKTTTDDESKKKKKRNTADK
jgi:hypothetical protein